MPNVNDNEAFLDWIWLQKNKETIDFLMTDGDTMITLMEHFNNEWFDYCQENRDEPDFPYKAKLYSDTQIWFGDYDQDEVFDYPEGTEITVLRSDVGRNKNIRFCLIEGNENGEFCLEVDEIEW